MQAFVNGQALTHTYKNHFLFCLLMCLCERGDHSPNNPPVTLCLLTVYWAAVSHSAQGQTGGDRGKPQSTIYPVHSLIFQRLWLLTPRMPPQPKSCCHLGQPCSPCKTRKVGHLPWPLPPPSRPQPPLFHCSCSVPSPTPPCPPRLSVFY